MVMLLYDSKENSAWTILGRVEMTRRTLIAARAHARMGIIVS